MPATSDRYCRAGPFKRGLTARSIEYLKVCAVTDVWSGLKLVVRKELR